MSRLVIHLLGPFRVSLDGEPVTGLESDKVRALLAYLAVEADQPHRREKLVGLLWPEQPEQAARANLRRALANLRKAISDRPAIADGPASPPYLRVTRQTVQFNSGSDASVDVTAFRAALEREGDAAPSIQPLEEAIALYRGSFLEGFFVKDSGPFEDWSLLTRERLQRQAAALRDLASHYAQHGELERACDYAWRQVELEPWQEKPYQQLMRLLARTGRRSEALAQYEVCRRRLAEELGVEPASATTRLYERIRTGKLGAAAVASPPSAPPAAQIPPFLDRKELVDPERPVFVARERELAALDRFLDQSLAGQGQVVFVSGEAGSGKTALVEEFALRSQEAHPDLVVAGGRGTAYTGAGDAYLPFREILALLTGDVEARYVAGVIGREQALRLWNTLPSATQALAEAGPDLIDTFVSGSALGRRALAYDPAASEWLAQFEELLEKKANALASGVSQQSDLFEQYSQVLAALALQMPLLLLLDDLQWADSGSIDLLFHLGRSLGGSRILVVGGYRPEEIAIGRRSSWTTPELREQHPLQPVLHEFQRQFGAITLAVGTDGGEEFVEAYLDSEPNRLGVEFREMLFQHTRGHALFTAELLQGLQERGDLVQDGQGRWTEGEALDWERLPPRIEGVIGQRVSRLPEAWQQGLRTASVQGEVFTAEVLARVEGADERETVRHLSGELSRAHRLVQAERLDRLGPQPLSQYRFRHFLFQKYLYSGLDPVQRARLHQATGDTLEEMYGDQTRDVAVELARHFEEAGLTARAVEYLHQAGSHCAQQHADQEAIAHFTHGLALLESL
ncbi:MAG TPA: BTAD domain-containing putative transcriptional regulator, partial [Anaerolineae bacterium]|nr:BTAD domain-containing putative transcriptional regulator [Anaerolineae bacterium]